MSNEVESPRSARRPRHDSLHDEDFTFTHRRTQEIFPTDTTHDMFVSMDGWPENSTPNGVAQQRTVNWRASINPPPAETTSDYGSAKNTCLRIIANIRRTWTWKHYVALGVVVTFLLTLLITAIVLLVVLNGNSGATQKNIYSTPPVPTTPVIPTEYTGYVRTLELNVFRIGDNEIESLSPVYEEPGLFLGLQGTKIYLFNNTEDSPLEVAAEIDRNNSKSCRLLSVDRDCFLETFCSKDRMIYCCSARDSTRYTEFCSIGGHVNTDFEEISSYRYNETDNLIFSTVSGINTSTIDYEKYTVVPDNENKGPKQCANFAGKRILAAAAAFKPEGISVDLLVAVSDSQELFIKYERPSPFRDSRDEDAEINVEDCHSASTSIFTRLPGNSTLIDLAVDYSEPNFYIALAYSDRFYFFLYTANRIYLLDSLYFGLLFPIELRKGFWIDGEYFVWFRNQDNELGIMRFSVNWTREQGKVDL